MILAARDLRAPSTVVILWEIFRPTHKSGHRLFNGGCHAPLERGHGGASVSPATVCGISDGFEGLVVKPLTKSAEYVPGKRRWLKIKKDSVEGLWDSLDLVPIGACYGYGKRAGVYGTFLLACYDCKSGEFQTICKAASGLTDEKLDHVFKSLSTKLLPNPLVWEVKAGGLTVSSKYLAAYGILEPDKGISLRFPRIHRFRPDKDPKQATSSDQVADMYIEQAGEDHPVNHGDYNDDVED